MKKILFTLAILISFIGVAQNTPATATEQVAYIKKADGNYVRAGGSGITIIQQGSSSGLNNDAFSGAELTNNYTFTATDFDSGRNLFWYNGTTDIEVNLPDVADAGEKLILWQYNSGKIQVKLNSGVNGLEFQSADNTNPITLTHTFDTSLGYIPIGNWISYTSTGDSPSDANTNTELYTGNAGAFGTDEANSLPPTGTDDYWEAQPVNATTTIVSYTGDYTGSHAIEVVATGTTFGRTRTRFVGLNDASNYTYYIEYFKTQGVEGRVSLSGTDSGDEFTGLAATTPTVITGSFNPDSTGIVNIEIWAQTSTGGTIGDDITYKLTVKED